MSMRADFGLAASCSAAIKRGQRVAGFAVSALLMAAPLSSALAASNLGFEQPPLPDGTPPGWTLTAADRAVLTDGEDGSDFTIYADYSISVPPLQGLRSLRLGTPKRIDESQNRGTNSALSDGFVPAGTSLNLAFRLFSLEHRGDDQLIIEVLDDPADAVVANLSAVRFTFEPVLPRPAGSELLQAATSGCSPGPVCALTINIGKRNKRPFDSGEYIARVTGLPAASIKVRYRLIGGSNEAHASWAYFDNVNEPPQAVLRFNPGGDSGNPALEGDFVVADCLESTDADGDDLSCRFTATGGGWQVPRVVQGDLGVFWFPDDAPATIQLTVTDSVGQVSTVNRTVNLLNAEPVVNALNVEVLAGTPAETVCRFLDAGIGSYGATGPVSGFEERHFLGGGLTALEAAEEHVPSFSSGYFRLPATGNGGTCVVRDDDGDSGSDDFVVVEIDRTTLRTRLGDETRSSGVGGNDSFEDSKATPLEVDWRYLATIADPQDIDVYRIQRGGLSLPVGSEVVIGLEGLPTDYDILVFSNGGSMEASPFFNAPFFNAPFFNAPFFNAPFFNAPFFNAQFDSVPFFNAPFFNAPFFNAPFFNAPVKKSPFFNADGGSALFNRRFDELPLSEVGLAAPDGSNVSNSDISPAEIGSLSLQALQATPGISLKGLSAQTGTKAEKLLITVAPGETELYVVVVGNDLGFSATQPYTLSLEASSPPSQAQLLAGTGFCGPETVIPGDLNSGAKYAPSWTAVGDPIPTSAATLILTQRERFQIEQAPAAQAAVAADFHPSIAAYWADFWASVQEYADQVGGVIVSIDGSFYEQADMNPCDVSARNRLAQRIRDTYVVNAASGSWHNPGLQSVVFVGGQNVVPEFAIPDETVVGNERDFTTDLWVRPGTPLAVATAEGFNLTDAPYTDLVPTPFRGRALFLEDKPVARLVESPAEIKADLDAFLRPGANSGRLAVGYDFFCDGTQEVANLLGVDAINGPPCGVEAWSAQTLSEEWLRGGAQMCLAPAAGNPLQLALVNAHMTSYAALSALGFEEGLATGNYADTLSATESEQCLNGTLTATIGCHSGLNVPDAWAVPEGLKLPFDARRDWVGEAGYMLAPRGYGLGDNTVSNRGTEGLVTLVFEELANGLNLGDALVKAKRRYVMGLRELDVHDEDSLINLAIFAPPQLSYSLPVVQQQLQAIASQSAATTTTAWGTLSMKVREGRGDGTESFLVGSTTAPASYDINEYLSDDGRGSFFRLSPGDAQATYGRPLIPVTLPVEDRLVTAGQTRIHGVALVGRDAPISPCPIDGTSRACSVAARFVDLGDSDGDGLFDFNPVFPLPQHDWVVYENSASTGNALEPQTCVETLAPTQLGVASTLDDGTNSGTHLRQSLVIGAGQFRCESAESRPDAPNQVVGQQRLYTDLEITALHPVGNSSALITQRDSDFDPPQATQQTVIANPSAGTVTATVAATDSLTGGSGISEIVALVYWDADQTLTGEGMVESYSAKPVGTLSAEPFAHTFVLPNAANQRLAFQYIDGAGNLTQKSLKGTLIRAIDVEIQTVLLSPVGGTSIDVFVGEYCSLQAPTLTYQIGSAAPVTFTLDDPPPGISVSVTQQPDPDDPAAPCDAIISLSGLMFDLSSSSVTLRVEIRASGAVGSDTRVLSACSDPNEADVMDSADIIGCGFAVESGDIVVIDMFIAGALSKDVQYRLNLPQFNAQFKYWDLLKTSAPGGVQLTVLEFPGGIGQPSQLQFRIRNLSRLGWNGVSNILFQQSTQSGVSGAPGQGFPDETAVFTGVP